MFSFDLSRWQDLWRRLGCADDQEPLLAELQCAYDEPQRTYHNSAHIVDCLTLFDQSAALAERPIEVELAIWFHDAIYDAQAKDNEAQSAAWAERSLRAVGIDAEIIHRVTDLILATRHDQPSPTNDPALIQDIDLSILGRDPAAFDAYDRAIAEEYSWVAPDDYRRGRAKVLESFLHRPRIYQTQLFHDRFEASARANLTRALRSLGDLQTH